MDRIILLLRKDNEVQYNQMQSKNFNLEIFTDVVLGLQAVKKLRPKLLVIDLATSRIAGIELLKIIRSNPINYQTKIIITAKNFNINILEKSFELGADYFIKYPFTIKDIEKIYESIRCLSNYNNLEVIASENEYDWAIGI